MNFDLESPVMTECHREVYIGRATKQGDKVLGNVRPSVDDLMAEWPSFERGEPLPVH